MTDELVKWWNLASAMDWDYGRTAFLHYHMNVKSIATRYGWPKERLCDCFAAFALLSPNSSYEGNVRSFEIVLKGWKVGTPIAELAGLTTYRACAERAYRALWRDPNVFSENAKKTYNFYRNIADPEDARYVTIDGHMHNLWKGRGPLTLDRSGFNPKLYETIAEDFRAVARVAKVLPCQFQATLWWAWKRVNGIQFDYQLDLGLDL